MDTQTPTTFLASECISQFNQASCDCVSRFDINSVDYDNNTFIDNIHVNIVIIVNNYKRTPNEVLIISRVESKYKEKLLWEYTKQKIAKTVESITIELDTVKNILKQLKYNKRLNRLMHDNDKFTMQSLFFSEFNHTNECSVCHEQTCSVLSCSHHLCLECMAQLRSKTCPLCRDDLSDDE